MGIDRSFYRPLTEAQYALYAGQVPHEFRFVVKAPALVTQEFRTPAPTFRFYRFDGNLVVFYLSKYGLI